MDLSSPSHRASVAVQRFRLTNNRRCYKSPHRCFKHGFTTAVELRRTTVAGRSCLSCFFEKLLQRPLKSKRIFSSSVSYESGFNISSFPVYLCLYDLMLLFITT
ncbi:hypothetical protein QL285_081457 [Trifolium repens]|nr:hypothetical protein QL285_081457 [Trifolium repens]